MKNANKKQEKKLIFVGFDSWERPVYEDENGRLWKDVDPRPGHLSDRNICSALNNYFDGEPDTPITVSHDYCLFFIPERVTW